MVRDTAGPLVAGLAGGLLALLIAGILLGWSSPVVHILGVLVVLLLLYLLLRRKSGNR